MTLQEINDKLGDDWFELGQHDPGTYIFYTMDHDIQVIDTSKVVHVEMTTDGIEIYEWEGDELWDCNMEDAAESEDMMIHLMNKWEARGCIVITLK